jgi:hypothetical protein
LSRQCGMLSDVLMTVNGIDGLGASGVVRSFLFTCSRVSETESRGRRSFVRGFGEPFGGHMKDMSVCNVVHRHQRSRCHRLRSRRPSLSLRPLFAYCRYQSEAELGWQMAAITVFGPFPMERSCNGVSVNYHLAMCSHVC